MKNKGFTLIELLATIVILGILAGIAIISYSSIIKANQKKVFTNYEQSMLDATRSYLINNPSYNDRNITLGDLSEYLEPINNPYNKNDKCPNSYVKIERQENNNLSFKYTVCLKCQGYQSNACS